jgi:hypothetical protein
VAVLGACGAGDDPDCDEEEEALGLCGGDIGQTWIECTDDRVDGECPPVSADDLDSGQVWVNADWVVVEGKATSACMEVVYEARSEPEACCRRGRCLGG